jgi:hypothetical protein
MARGQLHSDMDGRAVAKPLSHFGTSSSLPGGAASAIPRKTGRCRWEQLIGEWAAIDAQIGELNYRKAELVSEPILSCDLATTWQRARDVATAIMRDGAPRPTFP